MFFSIQSPFVFFSFILGLEERTLLIKILLYERFRSKLVFYQLPDTVTWFATPSFCSVCEVGVDGVRGLSTVSEAAVIVKVL